MSKLSNRIFSAMQSREGELLDQIESDLDKARDEGSVTTEQYDIVYEDGSYKVHDKVNDEFTTITSDGDSYTMTDLESPCKSKSYSGKSDYAKDDLVMKVMFRDNPQLGSYASLGTAIITKVNPKSVMIQDEKYDISSGDKIGKSSSVYGSSSYKVYNKKDAISILKKALKSGTIDKVRISGGENAVRLILEKLTSSKSFSPDTKEFAGSFVDGNPIMRIGDYDVMIDINKKVAEVMDENLSIKFNPKDPLSKVIDHIKSEMNKKGLKVFCEDNLKNFSSKVRATILNHSRSFSKVDYKKRIIDNFDTFKLIDLSKLNQVELDRLEQNLQLDKLALTTLSKVNSTSKSDQFIKSVIKEGFDLELIDDYIRSVIYMNTK